jgi:manganese/iron transport system substrate-binding protein
MFSRSPLNLFALILAFGVASCAPTSTDAPSSSTNATTSTTSTASATSTDKPLVVASHSVLCDLTKQIAQDTINLKCLIPAGTDPHVYQASPDDRKSIESAQLVLYGGYNFEPSITKLIAAGSTAATKIAVGELAVPKPLLGEHEHGEAGHSEAGHSEAGHSEAGHSEAGHSEADHAKEQHSEADHASETKAETKAEAQGEAKAAAETEVEAADPHVWNSAQNGIKMVTVIQNQLSQTNPSQAEQYKVNAQKLIAELTQIDRWITEQVATIPSNSRKLVTTHDALGYYADAYKIPVETALVGLSTEEAPTATRVKELVDEVKAAQVPTLFTEASTSSKLIETVAKEAKVKLSDQELFADGLGAAGSPAETYQKMLVANTEAIVKGLGGKFTPFVSQ